MGYNMIFQHRSEALEPSVPVDSTSVGRFVSGVLLELVQVNFHGYPARVLANREAGG
jgi:hypothetical protein